MTEQKKYGCIKWALILCLLSGIVLALGLGAWTYPHSLPLLWHVPYTSIELGKGFKSSTYEALSSVKECTKKRFHIYSGFRSPENNGGVQNSQHLKGLAVDLKVPQSERAQLYDCAIAAGFTGYGWGNTSVHLDLGPQRWWTYDGSGNNVNYPESKKYLHKAPENFKSDPRWGNLK